MNDSDNYIGSLQEKLDAEVDQQRIEDGKPIDGICYFCRTYKRVRSIYDTFTCADCLLNVPGEAKIN